MKSALITHFITPPNSPFHKGGKGFRHSAFYSAQQNTQPMTRATRCSHRKQPYSHSNVTPHSPLISNFPASWIGGACVLPRCEHRLASRSSPRIGHLATMVHLMICDHSKRVTCGAQHLRQSFP